jgi:phosphoadenosine phosphosulfate reductase
MIESDDELEHATPRERLEWALERFGDDLLFTSSFGAQSAVLLHLWSEVARAKPVIFLDTGFHFPETIAYRDRLVERLGLTLEIASPAQDTASFVGEHGTDIQLRDSDFCCAKNKIEPLAPYRARAKGWISGLRRDQASTRKSLRVLEQDGHLVKVHPLVTLTAADIKTHMRAHDLPEHPLVARRYLSIGCAPCTRPIEEGEDERAGRWAFSGKTECGLHTSR